MGLSNQVIVRWMYGGEISAHHFLAVDQTLFIGIMVVKNFCVLFNSWYFYKVFYKFPVFLLTHTGFLDSFITIYIVLV